MRKVLIVLMVCLISFSFAQDGKDLSEQNYKAARDSVRKYKLKVRRFYDSILEDKVVEKSELDSLHNMVLKYHQKEKEIKKMLDYFDKPMPRTISPKFEKLYKLYYSVGGWRRWYGKDRAKRMKEIIRISNDVKVKIKPTAYWCSRVMFGILFFVIALFVVGLIVRKFLNPYLSFLTAFAVAASILILYLFI